MGWRHSTFSWSLVILFLLLVVFVIILVLLVANISAEWWASARDSPEVYLRSFNTRKVVRHITHAWRTQRAHGVDLRKMKKPGIETRATSGGDPMMQVIARFPARLPCITSLTGPRRRDGGALLRALRHTSACLFDSLTEVALLARWLRWRRKACTISIDEHK
ncbi:hypothetical protein FJTKL_13287 [Diaporthe vaccinii]|uniref:Uncharacterized protein n=1 Tax=Diaporthe vaccinii TaxID=105482 RepID=A0ABR4EB97_9PEZI